MAIYKKTYTYCDHRKSLLNPHTVPALWAATEFNNACI